MDREKLFKQMIDNNNYNKMNSEKNINNNISKMNVEKFFRQIEKENDNKSFFRFINIHYNSKGAKIPKGEKNNLTIDEIKNNRGDDTYNTLSLAVKHIPDLYVVDYDTHHVDCEFYEMLNNDCVAYTDTKKGSHYYIKIKNIGNYSNQQKIHINPKLDVDLIKKNNIWETRTRTINGSIKEYDWNDIKKYFDCKKMNFENSPASTPPASPNATDEEDEEIEFTLEPIKNKYDIKELQEILNILGNDCYEYDTFIKIGMALNNVTEADEIGKGLFIDWAKKDKDNFDLDFINTNWKYWKKQKKEKKLGYSFLKKLKEKYEPQEKKSLQSIFMSALTNIENGEGRGKAKIHMLKEMNKRLIYISETSNFVVPTYGTIIDYNDEGEIVNTKEKGTYHVKGLKDVKIDFQKENFEYSFVDDEGKNKTIKINPLNEWLEWIDRNEKEKIEFDPNNKENPFIFNIWCGYNIKKDDCKNHDEATAQPVLDHIKNIWCRGNDENYEYVMNYLAHIIQKPYKKTGVCLALHSKQGAGKGVVLKLLENIIGDNHYSQNSNAERVFGKFNGLLEAKTLINLDEAFWGGDKKLEGQIKNQITETTQTIEKKSLNSYNINDFCNYIITTNNAWFAGVDEEDRRYFCLELSNEYSGRDTDKKEKYFNEIRKVTTEAFAKVLYNRDISSFNPRKFKKTKLLQEQVELNWTSPKVWWNTCLKDGGFNYDGSFIEWGKTLNVDKGNYYENYGLVIKNKKKEKRVVYDKDWLYKVYENHSYDGRKFSNSTFWRDIQKNCIGDLYEENKIQKKKERKLYVFLPSLEEAREKWYDLQDFDYGYNIEEEDEWACDSDSDDEY